MSVPMTSINAYYELKEEGKISKRQELAFMTVRNFYEEKGYWPTPKEVHAYLAVEKGNEMAQFEGPNMVKPRITELLEDPGDDYPDLLEKKQVTRKQEYIEELLDDYDSKKATPVKIAESVIDRQDIDTSEDEKEADEGIESEESESGELDTGDVIFGGEDEEALSQEESGDEAETMTVDGVEFEKKDDYWVSEDGQDYVFPPGKDEDDYDELDEGLSQDGSGGLEEDQEADEEKEEKQASINQI